MIKEEEKEISSSLVAIKETAMEEEKKEISSSSFFLIKKETMTFGKDMISFSSSTSIIPSKVQEEEISSFKKELLSLPYALLATRW